MLFRSDLYRRRTRSKKPILAYGVQYRRRCRKSVCPIPLESAPIFSQVTAILQDYDDAIQRANAFDASLAKNASDISSHYADLVSLTARQAMAGVELTVGGSESNWNTSDVQMFMKDIGSSK